MALSLGRTERNKPSKPKLNRNANQWAGWINKAGKVTYISLDTPENILYYKKAEKLHNFGEFDGNRVMANSHFHSVYTTWEMEEQKNRIMTGFDLDENMIPAQGFTSAAAAQAQQATRFLRNVMNDPPPDNELCRYCHNSDADSEGLSCNIGGNMSRGMRGNCSSFINERAFHSNATIRCRICAQQDGCGTYSSIRNNNPPPGFDSRSCTGFINRRCVQCSHYRHMEEIQHRTCEYSITDQARPTLMTLGELSDVCPAFDQITGNPAGEIDSTGHSVRMSASALDPRGTPLSMAEFLAQQTEMPPPMGNIRRAMGYDSFPWYKRLWIRVMWAFLNP